MMDKKLRKTRINFYSKLAYINKKNYMDFVIYFLKANIFSVFMEWLITVYSLTSLVLFTKHFLKNTIDTISIFYIIIIPLISFIVFGVPFSIAISIAFIDRTYQYSLDIENSKLDNFTIYKNLLRKYRKMVVLFHSIGNVIYAITAFFICVILTKYDVFKEFYNNLKNPQQFIAIISIMGFFFGLMWNVAGFCRNNRVDWHTLIKKFKSMNRIQVMRMSCKYFYLHSLFNIISFIVISVIFGYIMVNLHPEIVADSKNILTNYNFLIVFFVTIFSVYCKKEFSLIYTNNGIRKVVFPSLKEFNE